MNSFIHKQAQPRKWFWTVGLAAFLALPALVPAGTYVQFRTVFGDLEVELMDEAKPITTANFLRYVHSGYYQNVILHRCVPGFVIQGGEFVFLNRGDTNWLSLTNVLVFPNYPEIQNEYGVGPEISNAYGTLAMARVGGQTNSATSQWFFNLGDNSELDAVDGGFTVFGKVIGGTHVLEQFNALSLFNGVVDMRLWYPDHPFGALFKELPVRYAGLKYPQINELIFVDITLLHVRLVRGEDGGVIIRWNSTASRTNKVQYTDVMPPQWNTLHTTNGTGDALSYRDQSTHSPKRFYRVIVE